jgi:hypothetical protein
MSLNLYAAENVMYDRMEDALREVEHDRLIQTALAGKSVNRRGLARRFGSMPARFLEALGPHKNRQPATPLAAPCCEGCVC